MAYIQVGVMALRAPDGSFLPATPIYREIPAAETTDSGLTKQGERAFNDISSLFAEKFKAYVDGCRAAGIDPMQGGSDAKQT